MLTRVLFIAAFLASNAINCQLPVCNLYHFTIKKSAERYHLSDAKFLTQFNIGGYNNQPYFFDDDLVYFTSNYYDSEQTEIASMDLSDNTLVRITYTEESEYSPTLLTNGSHFSCVRVETDGETQSIQTYPLDGMGISKRYMNNTANIGYHAWLSESVLAMFLVEAPHHLLAIADAQSERRSIILDHIGRTLKVNSDGLLYFVHKLNDTEWFIKSYDHSANKLTSICPTLEQVEDFELLEDGSVLAAKGSKLYYMDPNSSPSWVLIKDMNAFGLSQISRIAKRKNRLIIVDSQ